MYKYLKAHENLIRENLKRETCDWEALQNFHRATINFLQHERLIHLMVTLFFCFIFLIGLVLNLIFSAWIMILFESLILVLLIPYIFHYFHLENGVQRLYKLDEEIEKKKNKFRF